ncbi:hypothetical protein [Massilia luteola]|uniref:hypothetical protein n=1 Tax=Massilia luteola TaxID=3081751 RepID=UPI002ACC2AFE|nr:hypothetical protein [Massilia sp. Gc5]
MPQRLSSQRRDFLGTCTRRAAGLAALALPGAASSAPVPVAIPTRATGHVVPPTIVGLSYETAVLRDPRFLAASNTALVALFRRLNPDGVLRLGGNTSDLALPAGFAGPLPALHPLYRQRERVQPYYAVPDDALAALAGFLDAAGWKVVFGLNLRADSASLAAAYAARVRAALGPRLLALQVGNEANNYFKTYAEYKAAWDRVAGPADRGDIAGPDSGANTDWVQAFGREVPGAPLLSRHYYREAAERGSLDDILTHDADFDREIVVLAAAARGHRHGFWLTETNSYYRGGRAGVSDAFAAALWGLDFTLSAAYHGAAGVCFQGGPRGSIESSLEGHDTRGGGAAPGSIDAASSNYSPIGGDLGAGFAPRPLYYGLLCARLLAGGRFHALDTAALPPDARVYATAHDDGTRIVAVNASRTRARALRFAGLPPRAGVRAAPLSAPDVAARTALVFGQDDRTLMPGTDWQLRYRALRPVSTHGALDVTLPAGTAILIHVAA